MDFKWSREQLAIAKEIRSFASNHLNNALQEREQEGAFYWDGWHQCAGIGIQGLPIARAFEGAEADILTTALAMENLGYGCEDNGLVHAINSHMWGCEIPIARFGSQSQKRRYLKKLSLGQWVGAHAVTEPDAGSDAFALGTTAEKHGPNYILNGNKCIVSNGPIADVTIVFAITDPKRGFMGGISAFILEKETKGLTLGAPLKKMGLNTAPICEMFFDDCQIPEENRLGKEGIGTTIFSETMVWERCCLFAAHIGAMERILQKCIRYAKKRHQFGKPIGKFQSISHKIAELKVDLELGKLILYKTAWLKANDKDAMLETAMGKLFVSESLQKAARAAVQIHGAYGYMTENGIERELRDAMAATIYSGTSEIQKNIIASCLGV